MTSNPIPGIAGFSANAPRHFWTNGSRGMFGVKLGLRRSESPQVSRLGVGYKAFVGLMGCFKDPLMKGQKGGFVDVWDAAAFNWPEKFPEHLIIMVNGIVGSAKDWRYAAQQFVKKLPDNVIVHCSKCNSSLLTFDGVDLMGERLAGEVLSIVNHRPRVRKISFVAHSLGGLVARYAIGRLYNAIPRDHFGADIDKHLKGTVAGLEPMNFITVATPHLGSRGHKQLPFLCGLPFLEQRASETAHLIVGRTGKHLFLTDNEDGSHPLLLRMTRDCDDLKFMSALCSFGRRAAYANANFDLMVGWRTSSIRRQYELPEPHLLISEDKYPHVVYVERGKAENIHKESSDVNGQKVDLEEEMIRGLRQVSWERVDVSFQKSTQRYIAHSTIQVKSYWMNSDGADIILHMIDNFIV